MGGEGDKTSRPHGPPDTTVERAFPINLPPPLSNFRARHDSGAIPRGVDDRLRTRALPRAVDITVKSVHVVDRRIQFNQSRVAHTLSWMYATGAVALRPGSALPIDAAIAYDERYIGL